jgi:hypothetical protein
MKPLLCLGFCLLCLPARGAPDELPKPELNPVKNLEARFEPAEAKPGQAVTLKIDLKLEKGWYTYPTRQPHPSAKFYVNSIFLPGDSALTFTGKIKEPANPKIVDEPVVELKDFHTYPGGGVWECTAVVPSNAKPGKHSVKVGFRLLAVNEHGCCSPPKRYDLEAVITIAGNASPETQSK